MSQYLSYKGEIVAEGRENEHRTQTMSDGDELGKKNRGKKRKNDQLRGRTGPVRNKLTHSASDELGTNGCLDA
jgi:hypothetical protein